MSNGNGVTAAISSAAALDQLVDPSAAFSE